MARVRFGVARRRRRKRVLKRAKGFWGARSRLFKSAKETVIRAEAYATRDRRNRKRDFRRLWITRISGALHGRGISYSRFIHGLSKAGIELNRKMLSELAIRNPDAFDRLVDTARENAA
ncbi:MAG: 50S ribosomal protein L20 [Planctomycetota bacterium]